MEKEIQLKNFEGDKVFPITKPSLVVFDDGDSLCKKLENINEDVIKNIQDEINNKTSNIVNDLNKINFELRLNSYVTSEDMRCVFVDTFDSEGSIILTEGRFEEGKIYI